MKQLVRREEDTVSIGVHTAILIGLGTMAVVALGMHALSVQGTRERAYRGHLDSVLHVGVRAIETSSVETDAEVRRSLFRRWSWAVLADRDVVGAAMLDPDGNVVEWQPEDLGAAVSVDGSVLSRSTSVELGDWFGRAKVLGAEVGGGYRVVLLAKPHGLAVLAVFSWWMFPFALFAGLALGWGWIRNTLERSLWEPLRRMNRVLSVGSCGRQSQLPIDRSDELGRLARHVAHVLDQHDRSRARVGHLERTMDVQIAERTRRIEAMLRRAERKAWIDPLTKLGNRQLLDDRLEELFCAQAQRHEDLSVIAFDLDNFKNLNDTRGHAAGDELLSFFGELLRGSLRATDIGLRLGGDEFVAILLGTGSREAAETADRLVKLFGQRASLLKISPKVTASAGVASLRDVQATSGVELLRRADTALYDAKACGKAQVCVCSERVTMAGR